MTLEGPASPGEAGPSGASPGETFPRHRPPQLHTVLQIQYARGPAPGNFFWVRGGILRLTDGRGRMAWLHNTGPFVCLAECFEAECFEWNNWQ